jgi:hypothetical protein
MQRWQLICLAVLAGPLWACDAHVQTSGSYALTATEILRDDCGVLAGSLALGTGMLVVSGEAVTLRYEPYALDLRGFFMEVTESFYLDGTAADVTATVSAGQCLFDLVTMHIEGTTQSATAFDGAMLIRYDAAAAAQCRCELSVHFHAERFAAG